MAEFPYGFAGGEAARSFGMVHGRLDALAVLGVTHKLDKKYLCETKW